MNRINSADGVNAISSLAGSTDPRPGAAHIHDAGPANPIQAAGTAERDWEMWPGLAQLVPRPLEGIRSALVLAAHPDDQILGFGGALARLSAAGVELRIAVATDGEASHPDSRTVTPGQLAERRRREDAASLAALGLEKSRIERLGLPDGGLSVRPGELADAVRRLIAETEADLCVAPWSFDMHPDHESVGRAAVAVGAQLGVPVWQYPVWMWHWALPGDPRVPWHAASRIDLPAETVVLKNRAINCHESQIAPLGPGPEDAAILAAGDLEHFRRDFEVVLT